MNTYIYIFGTSCNRFTPGLTVDGYKSRVNIVPVNRAGIRKASGFGGNEPKGVARWFARATIYVARYEKCRGRERKADYAYFLKGYGAPPSFPSLSRSVSVPGSRNTFFFLTVNIIVEMLGSFERFKFG